MGTLNYQTIENRETVKNAGYNHVSTYGCQLAKNKDFRKFAKNFTQEIVTSQSTGSILRRTDKRNQTALQLQRKRVWTLCRLLVSVSNSPVLPKISNWSPYQNTETRKYDKSWYGLIKRKVVPPKGLYHPVLPQRIKADNYEKLVFTLCKACAETRNQNKC